MDYDAVFKALADPTRRRLLDALHAHNGQRLHELCAGTDLTRQAVTKHLAILEAANLVATTRSGREKLHYLNPAPLNDISARWLAKYDQRQLNALATLKQALEDDRE
ncbi:ArsR/SmtB family transcription factor [Crossiella sp. NPDC003009]